MFLKHIQNLHITVSNLHCFQCMFPINILPSIRCFPSTNVVSNLNALFPSYFFVSYLIIMSTYYRSKYFWNVKMGFEQFRFAFSSLSKVKGKLMAFLKNFFLDFSKSVPAQKILITTRFFCLIMLHLIVNCKNHHSEVCHLSKKIIKWVFLCDIREWNIMIFATFFSFFGSFSIFGQSRSFCKLTLGEKIFFTLPFDLGHIVNWPSSLFFSLLSYMLRLVFKWLEID